MVCRGNNLELKHLKEIKTLLIFYSFYVNLSVYHYGLSGGAVRADDGGSAADHGCSQRRMDGVSQRSKIRMLLSDVLNHLGLKEEIQMAKRSPANRSAVGLGSDWV